MMRLNKGDMINIKTKGQLSGFYKALKGLGKLKPKGAKFRSFSKGSKVLGIWRVK